MWWLLLPVAFVVCVVVVSAVGAALNSGPKHPRHAAPRHLEAVPDLPSDWGSMVLEEERTVQWQPPAYLLAAPVDVEPWRARIEDELSPEALDTHYQDPPSHNVACANDPGACPWPDGRPPAEGGPWRVPDGFPMGQVVTITDPGAGDVDVVSSAPAPDPDWLAAQMAILFDWVRSVHAGVLA